VRKIPKTTKSDEESLRNVQLLLASLLLKEEPRPDVKKLAKLTGVSDNTITDLFRQRAPKKKTPQSTGRTKSSPKKEVKRND
jgi:hypothetical protein